MGYGLRATGYGLRATGYGLRASGWWAFGSSTVSTDTLGGFNPKPKAQSPKPVA